MQELISAAKYSLKKLTEHGAAKAQCYVEDVVRTEARLRAYRIRELRTVEQQKMMLTAIDAENRLGTITITSINTDDIDVAVEDCIAHMKDAVPDQYADIAQLTHNENFVVGPVECDKAALVDYVDALIDRFEKKPRTPQAEDELNGQYEHHSKKSAILNTNGVELTQHIGWYQMNKNKIADLDVDVDKLSNVELPYDAKKWADAEVEPIGEKFVGTVLLNPSGMTHLWFLSRMVLINDNALCDDAMPAELRFPWADKAGEKVISDKLTIEEHLLDPRIGGIDRFTSEGYPVQDLKFIKNGVVSGYPLSQKAAKRRGMPVNSAPQEILKTGKQVFVEAGDTPVAQIISGIKHGIIVNSLRSCPRDAKGDMNSVINEALLIEDGVITRKVRCMASCNFFDILNNVSAVSSEVHFNGESETPWIAFEGFHVS